MEPRHLSRRSLLQLGALAGLTAALPIGHAAAQTATKTAKKTTARAAASLPLSGPLSLTSSSQLSQEYFRTSDVLLDDADQVYPLYRGDGTAAALVLQSGVLSLTAPDPTKPGGFSQTTMSVPTPTLPGASVPASFITAGPVKSLAVGTHSDGTTWVMLEIPTTLGSPFSIRGEEPRGYMGASFVYGTIAEGSGAAPTIAVKGEVWSNGDADNLGFTLPGIAPKITYDAAGNLTFYIFVTEAAYVLVPVAKGPQGPVQMGQGYTGDIITDALLMQYNGHDWIVQINNTQKTLVLQVGQGAAGLTPIDIANCTLLGLDLIMTATGLVPALMFWMKAVTGGSSEIYLMNLEDLATRSPDGKTWYSTPPTPVAYYADFDSAAVVNSGGLWCLASAAPTQVNDVTRQVVSLNTQYRPLDTFANSFTDTFANSFTDTLPFDNNSDRVWAPLSRKSSATTLFVRDSLEQSLTVIAQAGPNSPWTRTMVKQSGGATTQDLTHWRTQLTVRDAHHKPVSGYTLSITADEPIGLWQETGNTVVGPNQPGTFVTDQFGRVVIGTPAEALHTATLTATGSQLAAVKVSPDGDVHAFLGGTGSLPITAGGSATGQLTAASLQAATVPGPNGSKTPLATVFTGQTPTVAAKTADAVVKMMGQCAKAGNTPVTGPPPGFPTQFTFDNTGLHPVYSDNTQPGYVHQPAAKGQLDSFGSFISGLAHDIESAWHAIEHVVVGIAKATFAYAADAGQWVGQFAVNFANGLQATFDYVIKDLKSAYAAVAGVLSAIGAAIDKALTWLRALLDGLIKDAVETAQQLGASIEALPGVLQSYATPLEGTLNGAFTKLKKAVDPQFDYLISHLGGSAPSAATPTTYANQPVNAGGAGGSGTDILTKLADDVQGNWLVNKCLTTVIGLPTVTPSSNLTAVASKFFTTFTDAAVADVSAVINDAATTLTDFVDGDASKIADYALTDFVQLAKSLFDQGITLVDEGIDVLIEFVIAVVEEFTQFLTAELDSGILGMINDVLESLGIDFHVTIANVACLVLAFPAVLLNKVIGDIATTTRFTTGPGVQPQLDALQVDIITCVRVVATVISMPVTILIDENVATELGKAPVTIFLEIVLLVSTLVQILTVYPGATPGDLSTAPKHYSSGIVPNFPWATETLLFSWLGRLAPFFTGVVFSATKLLGIDIPDNRVIKYSLLAIFGSSLLLTQTFIAVDQVDKAPGGAAEGGDLIGVAALAWLSTIFTFLNSDNLNGPENLYVFLLIKDALTVSVGSATCGLLMATIA